MVDKVKLLSARNPGNGGVTKEDTPLLIVKKVVVTLSDQYPVGPKLMGFFGDIAHLLL